jgi:hypothetical protein
MRCEPAFNLPRIPASGAIFACALLLCSGPVDAAETPLAAEEYALWSAVLQHGLGADAKEAVIAEATTGAPGEVVGGATPETRAPELQTTPELLAEWVHLNARTFHLETRFKLNIPYVLLRESDRDLLFRGDDPVASWKLFFARYPGSSGIIRLSRVAFDAAEAQALVYVELDCGAECGTGRLVQASRGEDRAWHVTAGELVWMAAPKS